jgi:recombination protein RecA
MGQKKEFNLNDVLASINKRMGEGVVSLAADEIFADVTTFPTGSLYCDNLAGIGGWPIARQIEIAGAYSVGKTHLALNAMIEMQKIGGRVAFVDAEHSFDKHRASDLGLNIKTTILAKPDYLEQGLDIVEDLVPVSQLIVFDSVGGSSTRKEYEGSAEDEDMGIRAKRLTRTVPKLGTLCDRYNCTIIWINQKRDSLSPMPSADHNNTPGGNNFRHQLSMRLFVKTGTAILHQGEKVGHYIKAKMVKNKLASPFREAEIPFLYNYGVCNEWELLEIGEKTGVITKNGTYFKHNDVQLGQGKHKASQFLRDNPELYEQIRDEIHTSVLIQE